MPASEEPIQVDSIGEVQASTAGVAARSTTSDIEGVDARHVSSIPGSYPHNILLTAMQETSNLTEQKEDTMMAQDLGNPSGGTQVRSSTLSKIRCMKIYWR